MRDNRSASGAELDHVVYDEAGHITTETNASNGDRFKFGGMEYDSTTGQYYDRARYYGPAVGRFLGMDPQGFKALDRNLYRYVHNSPADGKDPTGYFQQPAHEPQPMKPPQLTGPPNSKPPLSTIKPAHTPSGQVVELGRKSLAWQTSRGQEAIARHIMKGTNGFHIRIHTPVWSDDSSY